MRFLLPHLLLPVRQRDNHTSHALPLGLLQTLDLAVVDKADATLGTVTATKLEGFNLVMTVSIRPKGEKQLIVRASAQFGLKAVVDPKPYQEFFTSLGKAMFLEVQQVD